MTTRTLTRIDTLAVLKHLAAGRGIQFTATASSVPPQQVQEIADAHGWPDEAEIAVSVTELQHEIDSDARASIPARSAVPRADTPRVAPTHHVSRPSSTLQPVTPRPEIGDRRTVEQMLTKASKSKRTRTKQAGEKIRNLVADLWERLEAEEEEKRAEAAAAAERSRYDTEVRRLEAELKAAREAARKARVRATPTPRNIQKIESAQKALDTRGYDPKTVRAWARENGVAVPERGAFLPKSVVEAWRTATAASDHETPQ